MVLRTGAGLGTGEGAGEDMRCCRRIGMSMRSIMSRPRGRCRRVRMGMRSIMLEFGVGTDLGLGVGL